jgi:hypothetical protein
MKTILILFFIINVVLQAKYLDSETCKECHEKIYHEHSTSMHHKSSLFSDEVHRKVKEFSSKDKYSCALCHMPATKNLGAMIRGEEQPNAHEKRQTDGVSCSYCHQITKIHYSKPYNINFLNSSSNDKPTMFGNLKNSESSDKHNVQSNEIYKNSEVCMGCHSHKENSHGFEVCNTKDQYNSKSDCIGCHMPKSTGGNEKFNKKNRSEYATHSFLGIHSDKMIKKAVKLSLEYKDNTIELTIENKMGHSIITHPMRLKFVKTVVLRDGNIIWSNFAENPIEDKEATFIVVFEDAKSNQSMPHTATGYKINQNLKAMNTKIVKYSVPKLQKGDEIKSTWISYIINPNIAKKLDISTKDIIKPYIGTEKSIVVE